jgi:hypothetical protein
LVTGFYDETEAVVLAKPFLSNDENLIGQRLTTLGCFTENQPLEEFEESHFATIDDFTASSLTLGQILKIENDLISLCYGHQELTSTGQLDASYLQKQVLFLPLSEGKADIIGIRAGEKFIPITVSAESAVENGSILF